MVLQRHAAGNIMTGFGILMSGIRYQSSYVDVQIHEPCNKNCTDLLYTISSYHETLGSLPVVEEVKNSKESQA